MIQQLSIDNVKCFSHMDIEMSGLNVLAGVNSAGKSTVIQTLLLVRQSYEMGALENEIYLNGDLVQIGYGYDLMNRNSESDSIGIGVCSDEGRLVIRCDYDKESDYLQIRDRDVQGDYEAGNLFNDAFSFVSADRIGPQRFYERSYHDVMKKNRLGSRGELCVDYLAERGYDDRVENTEVLFDDNGSASLIHQVGAWLSEMSPGVKLDAVRYEETGIVGMQYGTVQEKYSPLNVGFGLSYVTPVLVALLKAGKGDLVVLENPEAHIHPRGQRRLGELISKAVKGGVQVVVETHSDHILNGIRLSVKNKTISTDDVRLNFFYQEMNKDNEKGVSYSCRKTSPMILADGSLTDWPEGFFDEWDKALLELL